MDSAELQAAASQARGGNSLCGAEVLLEMRAQLSTAMPWAPMVRALPLFSVSLLLSTLCL